MVREDGWAGPWADSSWRGRDGWNSWGWGRGYSGSCWWSGSGWGCDVGSVAAEDAVAAELPSVSAVLRCAATRPGSRIELLTAKALRKQFKAARRTDDEAWTSRRCLSTEEERRDAPKKLRPLYAKRS